MAFTERISVWRWRVNKRINWSTKIESSSTLRVGKSHKILDFSASMFLHSIRTGLIWSALIFSKLKQ